MLIIKHQVVATPDKQIAPWLLLSDLNVNVSQPRRAETKGLFAFQNRNAAQASYSRSGAFLKWFDVSPHHKRVEAYSADYDPGTRGLCRPAHRVPFVKLAACPIDDRCKETLTPIYLGMGLLCPKNP